MDRHHQRWRAAHRIVVDEGRVAPWGFSALTGKLRCPARRLIPRVVESRNSAGRRL